MSVTAYIESDNRYHLKLSLDEAKELLAILLRTKKIERMEPCRGVLQDLLKGRGIPNRRVNERRQSA